MRQTLVWIWKDEELHAEYLRGLLLQRGGLGVVAGGLRPPAAGRAVGLGHGDRAPPRPAPRAVADRRGRGAGGGRRGDGPHPPDAAARAALPDVPPLLRAQRRAGGDRRAAPTAASSSWPATTRSAGVRADPRRRGAPHGRVPRARRRAHRRRPARPTAGARAADRASSPRSACGSSRRRCAGDGRRRRAAAARRSARGAPVAVRSGTHRPRQARACWRTCLDRAGLGELAAGARTAAIRASFMLGYDRARPLERQRPRARRRAGRGTCAVTASTDVAVLEAPTVYGNLFAHRIGGRGGALLRLRRRPTTAIVDIGDDLRPFAFERGFVQQAISATWLDADLRIVMPKLRTDPTEFAHLCLSTLEGSTGADRRDVLRGPPGGLPVRDDDAARRRAARTSRSSTRGRRWPTGRSG